MIVSNVSSDHGRGGGGGGHFNFVCTGVCGGTLGKLTNPETKVSLSINKNRPIPRLCTIKHEPKLT